MTDIENKPVTVVIEATLREPLDYCPDYGTEGRLRDDVIRRLTDVPITGHSTRLHVRLPRYQCVRPRVGDRSSSTSSMPHDPPSTPIPRIWPGSVSWVSMSTAGNTCADTVRTPSRRSSST